MGELRIQTRRNGSTDHFLVQGTLDLASTPQLRAAVLDAITEPGRELVVDVSDVSFLDCTAVGALVQVRNRAEERECQLRIAGATGIVLEVLEIAGVAKSLGVYADPGIDSDPRPEAPHEWLGAYTGSVNPGAVPSAELIVSMLDTMSELTPGGPEHTRIRNRVITACSPLATSLARRFRSRGEQFDDLNQVAMIGLLKAVDGFNPQRGRDFFAYATPTILGELRRHFRDRTWSMTVPRRHKDMRLLINSVQAELTQRLGRAPTVAELAEHLGVPTTEVLEAIEAAQAYQSTSLFTPVGGDESITIADLVGTTDPDMDAAEDRIALGPMIARLPEREQQILTMRFYGNMTQSQIAEQVGVSQMHVSRLLKGALEQLRRDFVHG
jgi:RNA polymerase sigma-B factor